MMLALHCQSGKPWRLGVIIWVRVWWLWSVNIGHNLLNVNIDIYIFQILRRPPWWDVWWWEFIGVHITTILFISMKTYKILHLLNFTPVNTVDTQSQAYHNISIDKTVSDFWNIVERRWNSLWEAWNVCSVSFSPGVGSRARPTSQLGAATTTISLLCPTQTNMCHVLYRNLVFLLANLFWEHIRNNSEMSGVRVDRMAEHGGSEKLGSLL